MKHLLLISVALLGMSPAAFADLTAVLGPSSVLQVYPPSLDPATCEQTGTAPCLLFSGTLTDTDSDGSIININDPGGISLIYGQPTDSTYLTLDSSLYYYAPLAFVGDPTASTDGSFLPNTYTGVIFGIDIAPSIPAGTYNEVAQISAYGGTNDPMDNGFYVDMDFTIEVVPEPSSGLLILAGLGAIVARRRMRVC
jgi:hypothetical protein